MYLPVFQPNTFLRGNIIFVCRRQIGTYMGSIKTRSYGGWEGVGAFMCVSEYVRGCPPLFLVCIPNCSYNSNMEHRQHIVTHAEAPQRIHVWKMSYQLGYPSWEILSYKLGYPRWEILSYKLRYPRWEILSYKLGYPSWEILSYN